MLYSCWRVAAHLKRGIEVAGMLQGLLVRQERLPVCKRRTCPADPARSSALTPRAAGINMGKKGWTRWRSGRVQRGGGATCSGQKA